jgi:hypothetical protein
MALSGTLADLFSFIRGGGYVPPPDPGNTANAPASPPVQTGDYQFIQETMYGAADDLNSTGADDSITSIAPIPPAYRDWSEFPVSEYGLSGLEGGGITGDAPNQFGHSEQGQVLYFDPNTGLYYDLGAQ